MSAKALKDLMARLDVTSVDIAAGTGFDPQTIDRIVDGVTTNPHRSTMRAIERFMSDLQRSKTGDKAAAG